MTKADHSVALSDMVRGEQLRLWCLLKPWLHRGAWRKPLPPQKILTPCIYA